MCMVQATSVPGLIRAACGCGGRSNCVSGKRTKIHSLTMHPTAAAAAAGARAAGVCAARSRVCAPCSRSVCSMQLSVCTLQQECVQHAAECGRQ
eukprot:354186-Chlamydomonas_euryale.AAC.1